MRPLLALNWKLHKGPSEAANWAAALLGRLGTPAADLAVLAPFVSLPPVSDVLRGSSVAWGSQDVSEREKGAYTGEVSATMLAELGCKYAVVGHSERRAYHGETDAMVGRKARAALAADLSPILCVGEGLELREAGRAEEHTLGQLEAALNELPGPEGLVIAYEPIWAIGTGRTATPDDAQAMGGAIRGFLERRYSEEQAAAVPLLYGGSVKPDNIKALCSRTNMDGALVGGASLELESVMAMLGALA